MKLLHAVLLILLMTAPVMLESCGCGDPNCPDPGYDFDNMTMRVESRLTHSELLTDPTFPQDIDFIVTMDVSYTCMVQTSGSAAYACSPVEPTANQRFKSITITSNNDFVTSTGTINAGNDLSNIFETLSDHGMSTVDQLLDIDLHYLQWITFRINAEVHTEQEHTFTFRIRLSDRRDFELVTRQLSLQAE